MSGWPWVILWVYQSLNVIIVGAKVRFKTHTLNFCFIIELLLTKVKFVSYVRSQDRQNTRSSYERSPVVAE